MSKVGKFGLGLFALCATFLMSTLIGNAQTEKPSAIVKVGDFAASTDFLNLSQYFQTTRDVTVKVAYVPTKKVGAPVKRALTLPAGTVVAGSLTTTKRHGYLVPSLQLYLARLSYPLLQQSAPKGYTIDPGAGAYDPQITLKATTELTAFKRVKVPDYMPGYSHGDLYIGGAKAALSPVEPASKSLRITPDGYAEVLTYDPTASAGLGFYQKPTGLAKITKTDYHDPYRRLYFSHDIKGIKTKRVSQTGAYQYRITLKNLHDPQHTLGDEDNGIAGTFNSLYLVDGTRYFTFIGYDGISG
ncbi:hypothetical protein [Levilactobacillus fujinensis]|uniref:Uncharacterized protein n=1 Tax=Levilactobacillus fujinensis TaxID=2486024 RepID=A0ABW1TIH8_9LACO|nr:hypothetical protein [Levilactobacillus fujinensis]